MNQKVVFLDVDGTIVNDKGIIPESTQIAITFVDFTADIILKRKRGI